MEEVTGGLWRYRLKKMSLDTPLKLSKKFLLSSAGVIWSPSIFSFCKPDIGRNNFSWYPGQYQLKRTLHNGKSFWTQRYYWLLLYQQHSLEGFKKGNFFACYETSSKKEALFDDPAMAAYQIEELLTRVLSEKERAIPLMKGEIDWKSLEKEIRYYIDLIYRMQHW